jgi:hypothetical protein
MIRKENKTALSKDKLRLRFKDQNEIGLHNRPIGTEFNSTYF